MRIGRIVYATDFSAASARALPAALEMARRFDAVLEVVHVVERLVDVPMTAGLGPDGILGLEAARERLSSWVRERVKEPALIQAELVLEGDAAGEIARYAESTGVDLIVMGLHGHSALERFLLGSVTEAVLRKAPCAVLAVPGREQK